MEKPNSIATRRVAVQYVIGAVDGPDADDEPDFIPARGVVEFTASVLYTPYPVVSGPNPMTVLNAKIVGILDDEGYLCTPHPSNSTLPGKRGVRLLCTDNVDGSVSNWTWTAAPKFVDANGTRIPDVIPPFSFYLPADPDPNAPDLDLTTVVKVPASQGVGNAQAEALAALASAAAASSASSAERAVAAVEDALEAARVTDAGIAGLLKTGTKTTIALAESVDAQASAQVPGLVAKAIATDGTIKDAARAAVGGALDESPRIPQIASTPNHLAVVRDGAGNETWLGARASDGGPTDWAMEHLHQRLGLGPQSAPGYLFALTDAERNLTDLAIRSTDGQFADFVIDRLRARILDGFTPPAQRLYADTKWVEGSEVYPIAADTSRVAGWGSSSMQGIHPHLESLFTSKGAAFYAGGKGSERAEQIAARMGSVPALLTVEGGSIPPSGAVTVTATNMSLNAQIKSYAGTLAGIAGTVSYATDPGRYIFTRSTSGAATPVAAGTPFYPDATSYRDATALLWMGKNNMGMSGGAELAIKLTDASFDWLAPLAKRCLVLGHFVDTNTAASSTTRDQIKTVNEAHRRRYGRLFVDVSAYLTGQQVWSDTGITPTPDDLAQQALGNKPPSLSLDNGHLNSAGYVAVTHKLITPRLIELSWY